MVRIRVFQILAPIGMAFILLLITATLVSAGAFSVAPLVVISGPSPFANCTVGATGLPGETLYPNAEEEPWVDVNPTDSSNIIAV